MRQTGWTRRTSRRSVRAMNRIAQLREARGWRQADLAEVAGLSQSRISRIERGDEGAPLSSYRLIADALGVGVPDLFTDERSRAERLLIEAFASLPPARQQGWLEMARLAQAEAKAAGEAASQSPRPGDSE